MKSDIFFNEIGRLKSRFGSKTFDPEFCKLLLRLVSRLSGEQFAKIVDVMIGERQSTRPPLIVDFREAVLREENKEFKADYRRLMNFRPTDGGWADVKKALGNVKTPWEAVQVLITKRRANLSSGLDENHGLEIFKPVSDL